MNNTWRTGNEIGRLYKLTKEDTTRVGDCWMASRLLVGDIAICIGHSGDCFFTYILIGVGINFIQGIPGSEFGSYCFGSSPLEWTPSKRDFHLLCAGHSLLVPVLKEHPVYTETKSKPKKKKKKRRVSTP